MKNIFLKPYIVIVLVTSLFCFASCFVPFCIIESSKSYPEIITIQVLRPSILNLSPEIKRIAFYNQSLSENFTKLSNSKNRKRASKKYYLDSLASVSCLDTVWGYLRTAGRFSVSEIPFKILSTKSDSLPWDSITMFCKKQNVQALLLLKSLQSSTNSTGRHNYNFYYPIYRFSDEVNINATFQLLDIDKKSLIDNVKLKKTIIKNRSDSYSSRKSSPLDNDENLISDCANFMGKSYAKRISPTWIYVNRYIYSTNNKEMQEALTLAKNNKWTDAKVIWEKLLTNDNVRIRKYCSYNLAVCEEVADNLSKAVELANKSAIEFKFNEAKEYLKNLQKRVEENKLLDLQFNK